MESLLSKLSSEQIKVLASQFGRSEKQISHVLTKKIKIDIRKIFDIPKSKSKKK
tara:strand:- start:353 stop:514 length:162 start_codon:yes stop_codon:yes gene_type:complete